MTDTEKQEIISEVLAQLRADSKDFSGSQIAINSAFEDAYEERSKIKLPAFDERINSGADATAGTISLEALLTAYGLTRVEEIAEQASTAYMKKTADSELDMNGNDITNAGNMYTKTEVDTALDGKAPAGFGLGGVSPLPPAQNLNNALDNGFLRISSAVENSPFTHGTGIVTNYNASEVVQNLVNTTTGIEMRRTTLDGGNTWTEEWVNPPMQAGVEYRTTERFNGKAVYTKLVNCGTVTASGSVNTGISASRLIDFCACAGNIISPYGDSSYGFYFFAFASGSKISWKAGTDLVNSGNTIYAILKYTKD